MSFAHQPFVTVALPVLNGGSLLLPSVHSVLRQSWRDWELLILDDGSTDDSIDQLYCLSDPRIIIVRDGHNRGLAARLNQAVSMAKGRYFARMDHDDICHPERFAKQVHFLENHPEVDLLATQCVTMSEDNRLTGCLPSAIDHADICRRPWQGVYMAHPTWMGRIEWFRNNLYREPAHYFCEDQELLLRAHKSSCYHTLPERLLAYRVRTHAPWEKLFRTHLAMLKMQSQYFLGQGDWFSALLSGFVWLARTGRDSWGELRHSLAKASIASRNTYHLSAEKGEWESLFKSVNKIMESDFNEAPYSCND